MDFINTTFTLTILTELVFAEAFVNFVSDLSRNKKMNLMMKYLSKLQQSLPCEEELKVTIPANQESLQVKSKALNMLRISNSTPPLMKVEPKTLWRNPYPQGTPAARAESLRVMAAAQRGEPI